jgi:hypothetical protein
MDISEGVIAPWISCLLAKTRREAPANRYSTDPNRQ